MKTTVTLLAALSLLTACGGPGANFSSDDARFKSLMNGETVEIIDNDSLDSILDNSDNGVSSINDGDNSVPTDVVQSNRPKLLDKEDKKQNTSNSDSGKKMSCQNRLVEQDKKAKDPDFITSPKEIDADKTASKVLGCGKDGEKKVLVCHYPNADHSKRKTLCIGKAALDAHLNHLGAKRGSEHVDFAGACQTDSDKDVETDDIENLL